MEHAFLPENFQRENRTTFLKFRSFPGTFQWNASKTCVPLTPQPEFLGKLKAPPLSIDKSRTHGRPRLRILRSHRFDCVLLIFIGRWC